MVLLRCLDYLKELAQNDVGAIAKRSAVIFSALLLKYTTSFLVIWWFALLFNYF